MKMMMKVPIIMGSTSDEKYADSLIKLAEEFNMKNYTNIVMEKRVCSAHKYASYLETMMEEYENNEELHNVYCYVTIAGRSNALSAVVDGLTPKPVIAFPPLNNGNMHDLYSSVRMPSGVSPMLVLGAANCFLAVTKVLGLVNDDVQDGVNMYRNEIRNKLRIDDIKMLSNRTKMFLDDNADDDIEMYLDYRKIYEGKVRTIYENSLDKDVLIMKATNRLSSFDRHICEVPHKGHVLNKISIWWFNKTRHIVPNHFIDLHGYDGMVVRRCKPFMVEFVVRSYMTGSTNTSIWKNYEKGVREYCGNTIRDGYVKNQRLDEVIITPTTKGETDELIDAEGIVSSGLMTLEEWNVCKYYAMSLFRYGQKVASENGMILVDTKYEFGRDSEGNIVLIDEVHTPDSSRYWVQHSYESRFNQGLEPENIDKDIIRKWIKREYEDPYSMTEFDVPTDLIDTVSQRYLQLYHIITGKSLSI